MIASCRTLACRTNSACRRSISVCSSVDWYLCAQGWESDHRHIAPWVHRTPRTGSCKFGGVLEAPEAGFSPLAFLHAGCAHKIGGHFAVEVQASQQSLEPGAIPQPVTAGARGRVFTAAAPDADERRELESPGTPRMRVRTCSPLSPIILQRHGG